MRFIFATKFQTEGLQLYQNNYQQVFSLTNIFQGFYPDLLLPIKIY